MDAPDAASLLTAWTWQPVALVVAVVAAAGYARAAARVGGSWPVGRTLVFLAGVAAFVWTTCGFAGAYLDSLFWVWTAQQLALLLVVPYLLMAGQPLALIGSAGARVLRSRFVRFAGNPLIGPALVPVLSVVLFFGPLPRWAIASTAFGWVEPVLVVAVGAVIVLPLAGALAPRTSLAVGLALVVGAFELVLDAVPGIALRLHRSLSTSYFDLRSTHGWTPDALRDQQTAGAVLWCVAELLDLPFLVLVFRQWLRADARDAAEIDTVLEAERIARGADPATARPDAPDLPGDEPWWLSDPAMRRRLNRRE